MVAKTYDWDAGATLQEHSRHKHKVLRDYFGKFLYVRSQLPYQTRFRLACVDGFAGGGRYACGAPGSPIIFLEEIDRAARAINAKRSEHGFPGLEIECLLLLNDSDPSAVKSLRKHIAPLQANLSSSVELEVVYLQQTFEDIFPALNRLLAGRRYRNVVFNLDQCGHSHVDRGILRNIMRSYRSVEIFYTFAIESLLAFLRKTDPALLERQLSYLRLGSVELAELEGVMSNSQWLGAAERIVFEAFRSCAPFVSPFSINNPLGWRYWLIHFATSYRARQVYNNVLHVNSSSQAHFGRSGLEMLYFDPEYDGSLYLFDDDGRIRARNQLFDDIPRLLSGTKSGVKMSSFYESIYNMTPAHADDVHRVLIENPDIAVVTRSGGERRVGSTISAEDVVKLRRQTSFFPMWRSVNRGTR